MQPGNLVEFLEGGRIRIGVCLEERKGRIRVLNDAQKEISIPASRILHASSSRVPIHRPREELIRTLRETADRRSRLAQQIDVEGLWEVLWEEGGTYTPRELAELHYGDSEIDDDRIAAIIRALLADRLYFRFHPQGCRPQDLETVEKVRTQRRREEEKERWIQEASQWIRSAWEGGVLEPTEHYDEIIELLKEYATLGSGATRGRQTEEVLRRAGLTHPMAAFQLLVNLGVWSPHENVLMHRFGTRREFPGDVLEEARRILSNGPFHPSMDPSREDLTSLYTVTIDSSYTRDIDDALSMETCGDLIRAGIHITDLSSLVHPDSPLDREAFLRATSLYLPEERIPMLPPEISEEIGSLKAGEVRPAVSLLLDVGPFGRILAYRFVRSWIRVKERFSYEEADSLLEDETYPLASLHTAARIWRQQRLEQGALWLPLPEVSVRLDEEGRILIERRDREGPAQVLVSEMMILANRLAAQQLHQRGYPCIYRCQAEPRERLVSGTQDDLYSNYKQRKLLLRAELQLDPQYHHGLGVDLYTNVTSPLRRYLDLVVQRQLTALVQGKGPEYTREDLEEILMKIEEPLGQASQLEYTRRRYWLLHYLEGKRGHETLAVVLGRQGNRLWFLLPEFMLEAWAPASPYPDLREGQWITVRIGRAKPLEDELKVTPS